MRRIALLTVLALLTALPVAPAAAADTDRLAGGDRSGTAVAISQRGFPDGAATVYLARADIPSDALAAGSLTDGPVLLLALILVLIGLRDRRRPCGPHRGAPLAGPLVPLQQEPPLGAPVEIAGLRHPHGGRIGERHGHVGRERPVPQEVEQLGAHLRVAAQPGQVADQAGVPLDAMAETRTVPLLDEVDAEAAPTGVARPRTGGRRRRWRRTSKTGRL